MELLNEGDAQINLDELLDHDDLTGIRTPCQLNTVGVKFLSHADFNDFPLSQQGKLLRNTLSTLIVYYCHKNHLVHGNTIIPDQFMLDTFQDVFSKVKEKRNNFSSNQFEIYYIQTLCMVLMDSYEALPEEMDTLINESKLATQMNNLVK